MGKVGGSRGKKDLKKDLEDIPRAIKQRRNGMPSRNSIRFVPFLNSMGLDSGPCSRCETFYEDTLPDYENMKKNLVNRTGGSFYVKLFKDQRPNDRLNTDSSFRQ